MYTLRLYDGSTLVHSETGKNGAAVVLAPEVGTGCCMLDEMAFYGSSSIPSGLAISVSWNVPRTLAVVGGPSVLPNRMEIVPEEGPIGITVLDTVALIISADNDPIIEVPQQSIGLFDSQLQGVGDTRLRTIPAGLVVEDHSQGNSPAIGLSQSGTPLAAAGASWLPLSPAALGSSVDIAVVTGDAGTGTKRRLHLNIGEGDDWLPVTGNGSDHGPGTFALKVMNQGNLVMMANNLTGTLAMLGGRPLGAGAAAAWDPCCLGACPRATLAHNTQIMVGNQIYIGDELIIGLQGAPFIAENLIGLDISMPGYGAFTLANAFATPVESAPPCPADYNQDGGIDGTDIQAFFADWEDGVNAADVNQDGGVDGSDVQVFFAAWENGGCWSRLRSYHSKKINTRRGPSAEAVVSGKRCNMGSSD